MKGMLTRKDMLKMSGAALAGASLTGCGLRGTADGGGGNGDGGGKNYTIRFSHVHPAGTSKALAAERFKEVVEEKSEGKITVEIFPNGELYADEDGLQALQGDSVEMLAPAAGILTTLTPQIGLLDLPYLIEPGQTLEAVIVPGSKAEQAIYENDKLSENNVKILSLWDYGFKQIWSNKGVREPDDLRGQKLRIYGGSNELRDQMQAWGANPTPMALSEVYNALQQGTIDGFENGYTSVEALKANEVLDYVTVTNHGYNTFALIISKEFFDSLPEDLQKAVTEAVDEATAYNQKIALEQDNENKKVVQEAGATEFIQLSEEDQQVLRERVVPSVWNENADAIGQEAIDELLAQNN